MSRSAVEIDFFRVEKDTPSKSPPRKLFDRRRSFRDIQSVISKINPEVLKSVITTGSLNQSCNMGKLPQNDNSNSNNNALVGNNKVFSVPSTPKADGYYGTPITAPMTIFYNGTVAVFDVPRYQAENILKLAEEGRGANSVGQTVSKLAVASEDQRQILDKLDGDLPIARRKSLQSFLKKRKERLTVALPYGYPVEYKE